MNNVVRLRLAVVATAAAAISVAPASAAPQHTPDWAAPQIRTVVARGLFGRTSPASFRPNNPLTRQTLANLAFGLRQVLTPPVVVPALPPLPPPPDPAPMPLDPQPGGAPTAEPATTDTTVTDPSATEPVSTEPASTEPASTEPASTDPTVTEPTVTDPAAIDPSLTTTTATDPTLTTPVPPTTEPAPAVTEPAAPAAPPRVARPRASATMAALDARLVASLGLSKAAAEFVEKAKAAGLTVPARFGTEVAARLLGLRFDHPAAQDFLELRPQDPATRAEAAYSAARILGFGWLGNSWQTAAVQSLADSFTLPALSGWQRRILDVAVSKIGMPYVWGGTSDGREAPFGVRSRGGYDCSGFVWRVYKTAELPRRGQARLDAPGPHDLRDECRGAGLGADPVCAPAARRRRVLRRARPEVDVARGRPHGHLRR